VCYIDLYTNKHKQKRKQTMQTMQTILNQINSICIYDWEEALFNLGLIDDYELFTPEQLVEQIIKFLSNNALSEKNFNDIVSWYSKREYNQ